MAEVFAKEYLIDLINVDGLSGFLLITVFTTSNSSSHK